MKWIGKKQASFVFYPFYHVRIIRFFLRISVCKNNGIHGKKDAAFLLIEQKILNKILSLRGEKVILDKDLAIMYGIETKVFNQAVNRHIERFTKDFMFTLIKKEWENLRSHFVTSSWGGSRYRPKVFTEQGIAMLSSILNSQIAIEVNIHISG